MARKKVIADMPLECTSEAGITVGLIDSIMASANALKVRMKIEPPDMMGKVEIFRALVDLKHNIALRELLCGEIPKIQPGGGDGYRVGDLIEKLKRFPSDCPIVLNVEEDYSGPAYSVTLEPQGMVLISDGQ